MSEKFLSQQTEYFCRKYLICQYDEKTSFKRQKFWVFSASSSSSFSSNWCSKELNCIHNLKNVQARIFYTFNMVQTLIIVIFTEDSSTLFKALLINLHYLLLIMISYHNYVQLTSSFVLINKTFVWNSTF